MIFCILGLTERLWKPLTPNKKKWLARLVLTLLNKLNETSTLRKITEAERCRTLTNFTRIQPVVQTATPQQLKCTPPHLHRSGTDLRRSASSAPTNCWVSFLLLWKSHLQQVKQHLTDRLYWCSKHLITQSISLLWSVLPCPASQCTAAAPCSYYLLTSNMSLFYQTTAENLPTSLIICASQEAFFFI